MQFAGRGNWIAVRRKKRNQVAVRPDSEVNAAAASVSGHSPPRQQASAGTARRGSKCQRAQPAAAASGSRRSIESKLRRFPVQFAGCGNWIAVRRKKRNQVANRPDSEVRVAAASVSGHSPPLPGAICGGVGTKIAVRTKKRNQVANRPDSEVSGAAASASRRSLDDDRVVLEVGVLEEQKGLLVNDCIRIGRINAREL